MELTYFFINPSHQIPTLYYSFRFLFLSYSFISINKGQLYSIQILSYKISIFVLQPSHSFSPFLKSTLFSFVSLRLSPTKAMILGCKSNAIAWQYIYYYHKKSILFRTRRYEYHNKLKISNL